MLIEYLDDKASRQLLTVVYTLSENAVDGPASISCVDEIKVDFYDDGGLYCILSRTLYSDPEFLSIKIVMRVIIPVKNKFKKKVDWKEYDIAKEIIGEDYLKYFSDPLGWMSLLIANLTAGFSGTPLITPVNLLLKQ